MKVDWSKEYKVMVDRPAVLPCDEGSLIIIIMDTPVVAHTRTIDTTQDITCWTGLISLDVLFFEQLATAPLEPDPTTKYFLLRTTLIRRLWALKETGKVLIPRADLNRHFNQLLVS